MTKDKVLRTRVEESDYQKVLRWCKAYSEDPSTFLRRVIAGLPEQPPTIPKPEVKL